MIVACTVRFVCICPPSLLTLWCARRSSAVINFRRRRVTSSATFSTPTSWSTFERREAKRKRGNQNTSTIMVTPALQCALFLFTAHASNVTSLPVYLLLVKNSCRSRQSFSNCCVRRHSAVFVSVTLSLILDLYQHTLDLLLIFFLLDLINFAGPMLT